MKLACSPAMARLRPAPDATRPQAIDKLRVRDGTNGLPTSSAVVLLFHAGTKEPKLVAWVALSDAA